MRTARTHYEVLGVPRDATIAQIRRRYRQLVRQYHPDVAADKETAHRLFLQIKEAYEVLSDPIRRREYDAALAAEAGYSTGGVASRPSSGTVSSARTTKAASPVEKLLKDARWSFIQRRFNEAAEYCRKALEIEPHSAAACAMLGDIFRAQGRINQAIKYYSYAVQFNPADKETERKLERLLERKVRPQQAKTVSAGTEVAPAANMNLMTVNFVWWGIAVFLMLLIWVNPGKPIPWLKLYIPLIQHWSWNFVLLLAASSTIVGMLLSLNGFLSHPDEELVFETHGSKWSVVPTGPILLLTSGFFFPAAAVFYIVVAFLQGNLSRSVVTVFLAVAVMVGAASMLYVPEARKEVLLFGGNVSFWAMLFGWYIGSLFKPLGEWGD
ncbi:MAG: J domain-containing protein [Armatimonadota bacterium]|nr:J domain-containing protein [Armatimonadota bacterium]